MPVMFALCRERVQNDTGIVSRNMFLEIIRYFDFDWIPCGASRKDKLEHIWRFEEVCDRLRELDAPITLFGESDMKRSASSVCLFVSLSVSLLACFHFSRGF